MNSFSKENAHLVPTAAEEPNLCKVGRGLIPLVRQDIDLGHHVVCIGKEGRTAGSVNDYRGALTLASLCKKTPTRIDYGGIQSIIKIPNPPA